MTVAPEKYTMTISRLTIENLGIKQYDRVPRVLAELISNCYDADASEVTVQLPFDTWLGSVPTEEIRVSDNGHGMTSQEVNAYYLKVGANRRTRPKHGDKSPAGRPVMGRKGIGKLAPFGVCRQMEVITAGGPLTTKGYETSHLILRFDQIVSETDVDYHPRPGPQDGTWSGVSGTTIVMRDFQRKHVPPGEELDRQLSARFGLSRSDWKAQVINTLKPSERFELGELKVELLEGTQLVVDERPVPFGEQFLKVTGWVGYTKDPYKDPEMSGVRIYARKKLAAKTSDFGLGAGFTGEFKLRSYIAGSVRAEWLDASQDFIKPDRQDIIWNSPEGEALQAWGQKLLKELAARGESSVGQKVWDEFLEKSGFEDMLNERAPKDRGFRDSVRSAARALSPARN